MRYAKHESRRGVLLLVILALLAMFGMVAVTFVVVASQARIAAEAHQRMDETTDPPRKLLNAALMQVLRGSTNDASAIGPHSLLEDVYAFNNAVEFAVPAATPPSIDESTVGGLIDVTTSLSLLNARRCVGGVLTVTEVTDTPTVMIGRSSRVVDAIDDAGTILLRILPFEGVTIANAVSQLSGGCTVLVNRTPFTGPGFTTEALEPGNTANRNSGVYANEDYDAADFQNMMLAAPITDSSGNLLRVIPSLHRPDLADYWDKLGTGVIENYILRPTKDVHEKFTGGNVNGTLTLGFNAIDGPWDVDNDGDGFMDSVWVDLGMPAQASPDGQLYKPLFAILCVDMDGRLNLNAHGCLAQINSDPTNPSGDYYVAPTPSTGQQFAAGTVEVRGQGYGPSEINLGALFSSPLANSNAYQALLTGTTDWQGRYGQETAPVPGRSGADTLGQKRWFNYTYSTGYSAGTSDAYASPPDLQGTIAVGLDLAGRPLWDQSYCGQAGADNPYELNPVDRTTRGAVNTSGEDVLFSSAELERILRCYDRDTLTLPPRLLKLFDAGSIDARYLRHLLTTDSVDVPVPGRVRDPKTGTWYATLPELLQGRGIDVNRAQYLFGADLTAGRKLNLNRPLQMRVDGETTQQRAEYFAARQFLARHLFCVAMLLRDEGYALPFPADPDIPDEATKQKLTIRRIAQWAVNVVDFIDADDTMTPFQYVEDPFTGSTAWPTGEPSNTDNLVWGMERPCLLLTETLAFHDRGVADRAWPASGTDPENYRRQDKDPASTVDDPKPGDDDLDQLRVPQGSLFVELYCTTEPGAKPTSDLYDTATGALDVNKLTGKPGDRRSPIWRLAITKIARPNAGGASPNDIATRLNAKPATFTPQTDMGTSVLVPSAASDIELDRAVSFARVTDNLVYPSSWPPVYEIRAGSGQLQPGEYLLLGPRVKTPVGWTTGVPGDPSPQYISLDPIEVTANQLGGRAYPGSGQIKTPKTMIATGGDNEIGISVSEPIYANHYPAATHTGPDGVKDWYGDPTNGPFLDKPLDAQSGKGYPLAENWDGDKGTATRTTLRYKYVLLQRLADPTRPYNKTKNPYLTVDWMPIDLTVFNGNDRHPELRSPSEQWPPAWSVDPDTGDEIDFEWDIDDPNADDPDDVRFETRERGAKGSTKPHLWEQGVSVEPEESSEGTSSPQAQFAHILTHSLGFLNTTFGNDANPPGLTAPAEHVGDPTNPFPWVTWNNRPLVNSYEVMLVPATSATSHGWEYTMASGSGPSSPYTPAGVSGQYIYNADDVGYAHLLNFFHSSNTAGNAPQFHRIFDFLAVPSRFAGGQSYVANHPLLNDFVPQKDAAGNWTLPARYGIGPELVPTYREPGKINLNTIYSEKVFRGLMNGFGAGGNLWDQFCESRRGYDSAADPADYPTEFARPFRSTSGAHLWPGTALTPDRDIESGLLRSDPDNPEKPLFAFESTSDINDTGRNPYFRYQGLMRLANLTTTRSNVYAVWITVGYFEAKPDDTITGGYQLGREMGAETGEIRRHRAFYMIDRSIPVGFERGEDHNVENTIMLQRYIEQKLGAGRWEIGDRSWEIGDRNALTRPTSRARELLSTVNCQLKKS